MEQAKERMKLGEILIQQQVLTPLLVKRILEIANATNRRFGQTLEDMGLLKGEELAQALACQFGYKIVTDIAAMNLCPETINLISVEEAVNNRVFPMQVKEGRLALAMADPTNYDTIASFSAALNLQIVPFIATTTDIMKAIASKYLGITLEQMNNTVLVVDTDNKERLALVDVLEKNGFNAMQGVDPEDGFKQALLYQPNLIITAKEMPFADGFAFFTTLQGVPETRRIPIILLSARGSTEEEATAFKRGFFDYIPTPVKDITLIARVVRAIAAGKAYTPHHREQPAIL